MMAAIGAAWSMTTTGRLNHSTVRDKPMAIPKPMPAMLERAMPSIKGCKVIRYALTRLPLPIIASSANNVWLNGGKAKLMGQRPASSQTPKKSANENSCQVKAVMVGLFWLTESAQGSNRNYSRDRVREGSLFGRADTLTTLRKIERRPIGPNLEENGNSHSQHKLHPNRLLALDGEFDT